MLMFLYGKRETKYSVPSAGQHSPNTVSEFNLFLISSDVPFGLPASFLNIWAFQTFKTGY